MKKVETKQQSKVESQVVSLSRPGQRMRVLSLEVGDAQPDCVNELARARIGTVHAQRTHTHTHTRDEQGMTLQMVSLGAQLNAKATRSTSTGNRTEACGCSGCGGGGGGGGGAALNLETVLPSREKFLSVGSRCKTAIS
jgi:hypothetical protein